MLRSKDWKSGQYLPVLISYFVLDMDICLVRIRCSCVFFSKKEKGKWKERRLMQQVYTCPISKLVIKFWTHNPNYLTYLPSSNKQTTIWRKMKCNMKRHDKGESDVGELNLNWRQIKSVLCTKESAEMGFLFIIHIF